jgi:hypothetical protein
MDVDGVPVIVGGTTAATTIVNGARDADAVPLLTDIVMLGNVPTLLEIGVPASCPVVALNDAQGGAFVTENVSVPPLGLDTAGVNV